jgi:serine/threonine-protein kinase
MASLRPGSRLGQYKIKKRIEVGGFAEVFEAYDTIEGIRVALKIPHTENVSKESLELFRNEVRLTAKLDHPNILPIKHAGFEDERFVIVYPLGKGSLADRLKNRLSLKHSLGYAEQALEAVAAAHKSKVLHMDLKPENFIVFPGNKIRLADFGLARIAKYTVIGSGSGTVGYIAPEQAMGKPSFKSDVFSLGLILYRMFSGELPEWPYEWPLKGLSKLKKTLSPTHIECLRRALSVDSKTRYSSAVQMLSAFKKGRNTAVRKAAARKRKRPPKEGQLKEYGIKVFLNRYKKELEIGFDCSKCGGPLSEAMTTCPWCAHTPKKFTADTAFPAACPRCKRGRKLDWKFCAWCYGPAFKKISERSYPDKRYTAKCTHCKELSLIPFAKYCPLCRAKVRRKWPIKRSEEKCPKCRWAVLKEFWKSCPWCSKKLKS